MDVKKLAKQVLSQKENMRYKLLLAKKRMSYSQWLEMQKVLWQEENHQVVPAGADDGDYVFLCAAKGMMTSYARKSIMRYFMTHPDTLLLYGDEDVQRENGSAFAPDGSAFAPIFKPNWSPDLLDSCFYFGSLVAMRKDFFRKVAETIGTEPLLQTVKENDYLVADFPGYVQWMHRCLGMTDGYGKGSVNIGHVAQILFHCESIEEQGKFREEALCRPECGKEPFTALCRGMAEGQPLVSVIIPSRDHPRLLEKCLNSVKNTADGMKMEVIIVDNGSSAENKEETEALIQNTIDGDVEVRYLYHPMDFNFSKMCNLGAEKAKGQILLFLNDDVELAVQGCIGQMAALAARPYTGAVGLKLYYPDSRMIQHAGITNLPMGPVHKLQFQEDEGAYGSRCQGNANYIAVTAACLMIEKRKFQEAGGFAEELQVAFNDVELCFQLYESGYHNVCMNGCHAYHHESLSRGNDEVAEKLERLLEEREKLYRAHPEMDGADPYYSIHLCREGLDTKIRPAYETAGNKVQEYDKFLAEKTLYDFRRDECVMVRIEAVREYEILGWSVVLGDNNACYEKSLMLKKVAETMYPEADEWYRGPSDVYVIPLEGQYRPDLQENMPDQENVALSGFHVRLKGHLLPPGKYRLGVAAKHRITGPD